jgi:hypothetical protein
MPMIEVPTTSLRFGATHVDVDGTVRPALNSEYRPLHWSEEGIRNFWRWFGNSEAVDSEGRPLVVYHGTQQNIDTFRIPAWFTTDPVEASGYAQGRRPEAIKSGANVVAVLIAARNPYRSKSIVEVLNSNVGTIARLAAEGHDAIVFTAKARKLLGESSDREWFVPFGSDQIRFAIGSTSQFAPYNPNAGADAHLIPDRQSPMEVDDSPSP